MLLIPTLLLWQILKQLREILLCQFPKALGDYCIATLNYLVAGI